jgi:hypothetical protein
VRGRAEPAIRAALGERRPRDSGAFFPAASPSEAQRTQLEDGGGVPNRNPNRGRARKTREMLPEPQAAPFYVCGQTHQYSVVYTQFLAHIYRNVSMESPPASLFHRGYDSVRSAMRENS